MAWLDEILSRLVEHPVCGYRPGSTPAAEPTTIAALALLTHGRIPPVDKALDWLVPQQSVIGSVGVYERDSTPGWATSFAVLLWTRTNTRGRHQARIDHGVTWLLGSRGTTMEEESKDLGHNPRLVGWPWASGTHSWLEPTAYALLALKAAGLSNHPRAREAVKLLLDRQLPAGGFNYGNTIVLGQELKPHVQPTGVALVALADEVGIRDRVGRSLDYLRAEVNVGTTSSSLAWALLGLGGYGALPSGHKSWLEAATNRTLAHDASPYKLGLLALADRAGDQPLLKRNAPEAN